MLVLIVGLFFLLWTPRLIFEFLDGLYTIGRSTRWPEHWTRVFKSQFKMWLWNVSYVNSFVNAFVYYFSIE